MDRVLALHTGSRGFDSHRGHMSERFFRSNRPGYPLLVSCELENCGIRVAVDDCSVTESHRWRPPYQTGKTVHVHTKHYKHEDGRIAPGVCGNGSVPYQTGKTVHVHTKHYKHKDGRIAPGMCGHGSVPLSHSGNVVTRIGHTHTHTQMSILCTVIP